MVRLYRKKFHLIRESIIRTYWASNSYPGIKFGFRDGEQDISCGSWAGDRIEMTGQEGLYQRLKEEPKKWKHVSDEAIGLAMDVINAACGWKGTEQ